MFKHTYNMYTLGVDIGGSHISAALIDQSGGILQESFCRRQIDTSGSVGQIISQWLETLEKSLTVKKMHEINGIGIAMPGPFDYDRGICLMNGVNKYGSLFGVNVMEIFKTQLPLLSKIPIVFENDANCFGLGESSFELSQFERGICITLGTGFGATFIENGILIRKREGVPPNGYLFNTSFKDGIAENYISSAWISRKYQNLSGKSLVVKEIADLALKKDSQALKVFEWFGKNLADCLLPWIRSFDAKYLLVGGSISKASGLFIPGLQKIFEQWGLDIPVKISSHMELSSIVGAAGLVRDKLDKEHNPEFDKKSWRKTLQPLLPFDRNQIKTEAGYDMYPYFKIESGSIFSGYRSLVEWIMQKKSVMIDGYIGIDWENIRQYLSAIFKELSVSVLWFETTAFLKSETEVDQMIKPFLGEEESVWGKKSILKLKDFFDIEKLESIQPDVHFEINIFIGQGAGLAKWDGPVLYIDIPKNEIQYRMRAGRVNNLGRTAAEDPFRMYKRMYFVDWPVLNRHRIQIKENIKVLADGQWSENISWGYSTAINKGLDRLSRSIIRVRPWFEAGAWGGQWLKNHISLLNNNEINYAWSFELIAPENGIVFESDNHLLEISFDWLMERNSKSLMGKNEECFGSEFPIRFDFLDTFDGSNLSIQCHPALDYIKKEFGENITQDETYYILDCKEDAEVYLGFQENIDPIAFRAELEKSVKEGTAVDIEKHVQVHPAHKHDLFLIPNGTIHSSGANNLVLEISSTPYIFTFKMYDWLRLDLNGEPRPINIDHAFKNLNFFRKGDQVKKELISKPYILKQTDQYTLMHLPTHEEHFYDVHRIEFSKEATISTDNQCHILMLVEGESIEVIVENGYRAIFNYAETFIIPAAAKYYHMNNKGEKKAKVVKAFIK